jgi:hypothetical protein
VLECGLLRGSFIPPKPIAQLRDLTRYRKKLIEERTRETQRIQKLLEDAGIKLDSVVSDVLGKSARAMLESLIAGERDVFVLAELAQTRMRPKIGTCGWRWRVASRPTTRCCCGCTWITSTASTPASTSSMARWTG